MPRFLHFIQGAAKHKNELSDREYRLFEKLRALRTEIAKEEHVPPYIVFSDKTLIDMCARMPKTREEMLDVNGVGVNKLDKYGERFMEVIAEEC